MIRRSENFRSRPCFYSRKMTLRTDSATGFFGFFCAFIAILALVEETKALSGGPCSPDEFRCLTHVSSYSTCISKAWECDGNPDCPDGSDEHAACPDRPCKVGQFQCAKTRKCVPQSWACDGEIDCNKGRIIDDSDENPAICRADGQKRGGEGCAFNKAPCPALVTGEATDENADQVAVVQCLDIYKFCDGKKDCPNGTDEGAFCSNKCLLQCTHECKSLPQGPTCYCATGYRVNNNGTTCEDIDECAYDEADSENACGQLCFNSNGSYSCSCVSGYEVDPENVHKCRAINVPRSSRPYLLFSTTTELRRIRIPPSTEDSELMARESRQGGITTFDFDHRGGTLCYAKRIVGLETNVSSGTLACFNFSEPMEPPVEYEQPGIINFLTITQIAYDWIASNWYFLDDSREIIYLCSRTLKYCRIAIDSQLNKPRGIALDPTRGFMFYTKWGSSAPSLERAVLDGSEKKTLVLRKIVYPYGLTLDYPVQRLYWVDTYLDIVERVDYDGKNRRTVNRRVANALFGITLFEDYLYTTSWRSQSIIQLNKNNATDVGYLNESTKLFAVHVYHRQRQPDVAHPCKTNNGGCQHICVPYWKQQVAVSKCHCHSGYRIIGKKNCTQTHLSSFLLFSKGRPGMIKMFGMSENSHKEDIAAPVTDLKRPSTFDFDFLTGHIYFIDHQPSKIGRQKITENNGRYETWIEDSSIVGGVEGMAVDWLGRNLYWTEGAKGRIYVASLKFRGVYKTLLVNLTQPRSIVIHADNGTMYWSQWDLASAQSGAVRGATMDGKSFWTLVSDRIQWPSGLTLDKANNRLYWADAFLDCIEKYDLVTNERGIVFKSPRVEHPYGLSFFEGILFFTELQNGSVRKFELGDGNITILSTQGSPLFEIKAYDNVTQLGLSPCVSLKCPHLCLLTSASKASCFCADGHSGPNCSTTPNLSPATPLHTTASASSCDPSTTFKCNISERCIPVVWKCDGDPDCGPGDLSDEKGCPERTCRVTDFQCDNGMCISTKFFCDGEDDCRDNSDEKNCPTSAPTEPPSCPSDFTCMNPDSKIICVSQSQICDGERHCFGGLDELDCPHRPHNNHTEPTFNRTECDEPSWLCDKSQKCVDLIQVCDGKAQCEDRSDEGPLCFETQCPSDKCQPPFNLCHPTPKGPRCYGTGEGPEEKDEIVPFVIFSNRHEIRAVDLKSLSVQALISSLKNTIALDFHHEVVENGEKDTIYWTDVIDDKIYRGSLIGGTIGNIEVVVQSGLSTAEGLAVDWIGQNLYWVESNLDQIEVAKLNGSYRRALIAGGMESPRAIALDPRYGLLFWTDWDVDAPRVESAAMTGEHRRVVVRIDAVANGAWPNGLTLDYETLRVYWIDARSDSIHTVKYDGTDHHTILKGHPLLSHPFAISLYKNHVYWTDWRSNTVFRADKVTGLNVTTIQRTLTQPFDIKVMHPSRQPKANVNPCQINNGNCSHLCLLGLNSTRMCACPHVMRLNSDGVTCVENDEVLLLIRNDEIRGVGLDHPDYPVIPTTTLPHPVSPEIDFYSPLKMIFWTEPSVNAVKSSFLAQSLSQTVIDTGLENPVSFAVDWISGNLYISSSHQGRIFIHVTNLHGEYFTTIYESSPAPSPSSPTPSSSMRSPASSSQAFEEAEEITSMTVDPERGRMYWVERHGKDSTVRFSVHMSDMACSVDSRVVLTSTSKNPLLEETMSLALDRKKNRLYFVNVKTKTVQVVDLNVRKLSNLSLPPRCEPKSIEVYESQIYLLTDTQILKLDPDSLREETILVRNDSLKMASIKIYSAKAQNSSKSAACSNSTCSHLCFPTGLTTKICACALGYYLDPTTKTKCLETAHDFLAISVNHEIHGLPFFASTTSPEPALLAPISKISMASNIDYDPIEEFLYWADSDHGTITRIKRDGTMRQVIVGNADSTEVLPTDWLTGLAVDPIAGNVYWADPKLKVIEVARTNGSYRHVIVQKGLESIHSLAIDPARGKLFWAENKGISSPGVYSCNLDGSNMMLVAPSDSYINGLTLDLMLGKVYWSDNGGRIFRASYVTKGKENREMVLSYPEVSSPLALDIHRGRLVWVDSNFEKGSVRMYDTTSLSPSPISTLATNLGDFVKDLVVISKSDDILIGSSKNPCRPDVHSCSELCLFNGEAPKCRCSTGIVSPVDSSCSTPEAFLIFSLVDRIDSVYLTGDFDHNQPIPSIRSREYMRNAIGITYDYKRQTFFYSDIQKGSINAVFFNGTFHRRIAENQGSVEGLTYGAVEDALYWTCNNVATIFKMSVATSSNTSKPEVVLKLGSSDKPRGIAIDACDSRLYWTNWNTQNPSVQRAFTNGRMKEFIITTNIRMPNAIALDSPAKKLYWADARLDTIERADYDGSNRVILSLATPQHPFAMTIFTEYIYWTDWVVHAVIRADKLTGAQPTILRKDVGRPMGIAAVYNSSFECFHDPCRVLNGGCSDVCNLNANGTVACSCRPGRVLSSEDRNRCLDSSNSSINSSCHHDVEFTCSDDYCIPFHLTCDGIRQCPDGSDENPSYCATRSCKPNYFSCSNGRCILKERKCDSIDNCGDLSDEIDCPCDSHNNYKCKDGPCIPKTLLCDQDPDCPKADDEMNCVKPNCSADFHTFVSSKSPVSIINCNHTTACIHKSWICDGQDDCWDNSDEVDCPATAERATSLPRKCNSGTFSCGDGSCISAGWVCDGEEDCSDGTDELNCNYSCKSHQFRCNDSNCIPDSWLCDGNKDCLDGSDESEECKQRVCSPYEFRCNISGKCIPQSWVCDGAADCFDESDEEDCLSRGEQVCDAPSSFRCSNHRCIAAEYYCDGENDCGDKSDEPFSCKEEGYCSPEEFFCRNGRCINPALVCNGFNDCGDNSDEDIDNKECKNGTCTGDDLFECKNGLCINETLTCDSENNCGDYSDEDRCNVNECETSSPCAQVCTDLKVGYKCSCLAGYKPHDTSPSYCMDIDECSEDPYPCDQFCTNRRGNYSCSCADDYTLQSDGHTCKANSAIKPEIIFTNKYYIRKMNFKGYATIIATNLTNAVALDFDWKEKCIYWSDVYLVGSKINRFCSGDSKTNVQTLHSVSIQNPDGLAVDWVGRNLYWCDKGLDVVQVSTLSGQFKKTIINKNSVGLSEPRALALYPKTGHLFWSDWSDRPHIGKAGMDGSSPHFIITDNLGWPNGLTIDYEVEKLFFADAREDYIAVADLDGQNVRRVISRDSHPGVNLHHVFAIAVFESYIYWTDWETKSIERCHKFTGMDCTSLNKTIHRPMDIRVYHPFRQKPIYPDPCKSKNCSALCLLTPPHGDGVCACPDEFSMKPSLNGSSSTECVSDCKFPRVQCGKQYKCVPFWWQCDGHNDCGDWSDEQRDCRKFVCSLGQFQCNNSKCLHPSAICDGKDDCGDGSDELGSKCNDYVCLDSQYRCDKNDSLNVTSKCLPKSLTCNGKHDCPNGDDEVNCSASCAPGSFVCDSGQCIRDVWACDGASDCADASDEKKCEFRKCSANQHKCNSGRCLPMSWVCDGTKDCQDGSDEPPACRDKITCDPSYFKCENAKCIPGRWKCDGEDDCKDGSDERNCQPRNCSESEWRCQSDGKCLPGLVRCDKRYDCLDSTDEANCTATCTEHEFQCHDPPSCIYKEWVCDGDADCVDGSDEAECIHESNTKTLPCGADAFQCSLECVPAQWVCDGVKDCADGKDENATLCAQRSCPPDRFRCANHVCIEMHKACDGANDCGDFSDEKASCAKKETRCGAGRFFCSGRCFDASVRCDGNPDCLDGADERDCPTPVCSVGVCPQICVIKEGRGFFCRCSPGYTAVKLENGDETCQALGPAGTLLIAGENHMTFFDPYKHSKSSPLRTFNVLSVGSGFEKMVGVTAFVPNNDIFIAYSDGVTRGHNRDRKVLFNHDVSTGNEIVSIKIDWSTGNLYFTSRKDVFLVDPVSLRKVTIAQEVGSPTNLLINVKNGTLYWVEIVHREPHLMAARMDGTQKRVILGGKENKGTALSWPSDIALDEPLSRIYIADVKRRSVFSVDENGLEFRVVFNSDKDIPWKIAVFEDDLYIVTRRTLSLLKVNKYGRTSKNNTNLLAPKVGPPGGSSVVSVLMLQEQIQPNYTNPCLGNPCHPSSVCVRINDTERTCLCSEGLRLEWVNDTNNGSHVECKPVKCALQCHAGHCKLVQYGLDFRPQCECFSGFVGPLCNKNRCSGYCHNKGVCILEDQKNPKCQCSPEFTGARCETAVNCCLNGGLCTIDKNSSPTVGNQTKCVCLPGFTGQWCESCPDLECANGAICLRTAEGRPACNCTQGHYGELCDKSKCTENFCLNGGTCSDETESVPKCACLPGFTGKRCEKDLCSNFCKNGGSCKISRGHVEPQCACRLGFAGSHCQYDLCRCWCDPNDRSCPCGDPLNRPPHCAKCSCQNGGTCVKVSESTDGGAIEMCRCPLEYGGTECETPLRNNGEGNPCENKCENGGVCTLLRGNQPHCTCLEGWKGTICDECPRGCLNGTHCPGNCRCVGDECSLIRALSPSESDDDSSTTVFLVAASLFLFLIALLVASYRYAAHTARHRRHHRRADDFYSWWRRRLARNYSTSPGFAHSRIRENVEITNPMYEGNLAEASELNSDNGELTTSSSSGASIGRSGIVGSGNFENPVYGLYEEKANLLQSP